MLNFQTRYYEAKISPKTYSILMDKGFPQIFGVGNTNYIPTISETTSWIVEHFGYAISVIPHPSKPGKFTFVIYSYKDAVPFEHPVYSFDYWYKAALNAINYLLTHIQNPS